MVRILGDGLFKGVAVGGSEPWSVTRQSDYRIMREAGAMRIRLDIPWETVQPNDGPFDWSAIDPVIQDATDAGLKCLAILHTTPAWANAGRGSRGNYAPPADLALVEDYCYQVVKRYLPRGVTEYEIGNEVNLDHPGWVPIASYYAANLLTPGARGVRRASREAARNVTILLGALAPVFGLGADPVAFLRDLYTYYGQYRARFDVVSYHPYTTSPLTDENMNGIPDQLNAISGKQIWATEYGVPTEGEYSVSEQRQAELVDEAHRAWFAQPYAGPMFWYSHRDRGTGSDREDHFGLLRADGSAKPALAAYAAGEQWMV
jgi:polysaccharide biosynthesis protein PslG